MLTADDYEWAAELVKKTSHSIARSWPGIDREDVEQEIWAGLLPNWSTLPSEEKPFVQCAYRHGVAYCQKERYYYTLMSAEWVYTPNEVRGLFKESFFDPTQWEDMPQKETSNSLRAGGVVVLLWDLREVWESLTDDQRDDIARVYRDHEEVTSAQRKACQRAVDAVTQKLNRRMASQTAERQRYEMAA